MMCPIKISALILKKSVEAASVTKVAAVIGTHVYVKLIRVLTPMHLQQVAISVDMPAAFSVLVEEYGRYMSEDEAATVAVGAIPRRRAAVDAVALAARARGVHREISHTAT